MTPEEIAANPKLAVPFKRASVRLLVFAPLKLEHMVQYVRVLRDEGERQLVAPDNERGEAGAAFWVQHPWQLIEEELQCDTQ